MNNLDNLNNLSQNSIDPNLWGSSGWSFMHYVALAYPENPTKKDKLNYKIFYYNLQNTLPCLKCALNYKENIRELPIDKFLNSRENLFKWTVDIHNMVNNELGKENYTYEKAYNKFMNTNKGYDIKDICMIIGILLLVILILYMIKK